MTNWTLAGDSPSDTLPTLEAALEWATQTGQHALGTLSLQSGASLPGAELSWKTYGTLAPARDNVIVYPTSYSAHHTDLED